MRAAACIGRGLGRSSAVIRKVWYNKIIIIIIIIIIKLGTPLVSVLALGPATTLFLGHAGPGSKSVLALGPGMPVPGVYLFLLSGRPLPCFLGTPVPGVYLVLPSCRACRSRGYICSCPRARHAGPGGIQLPGGEPRHRAWVGTCPLKVGWECVP